MLGVLLTLVAVQTPTSGGAPPMSCTPVDTIRINGGSPTGSYRRAAEAIRGIVTDSALIGECLAVTVANSAGSVDNVDALARGIADLALVQGDIAHFATRLDSALFSDSAIAARGTTYDRERLRAIRAVMGLHTERVLIIADTALGMIDALDITPAHRIVVGGTGSGTYANALQILRTLGVAFDPDRLLAIPSRAALEQGLMAAGIVDVVFLTAAVNEALVDRVHRAGAEFVPLTADAAMSLALANPYFDTTTVSLRDEAIRTVELRAVLVAGPSVGNGARARDRIAAVTRSLLENLVAVQRQDQRFRGIQRSTVTGNVPIAWHPGAERAYCAVGLLSCDTGLIWLFAVLIPFLIYASLGFTRMRSIFARVVPRPIAGYFVGPFGTTAAWGYWMIPFVQLMAFVLGVVAIRSLEADHAQDTNTQNVFGDMPMWQNMVWVTIFATTGYENERFPSDQGGKFIASVMHVIGAGGVLLLIGALVSDNLARLLKMGVNLKNLRDHTILCGWNDRAPGLVQMLSAPDLKGRRQIVVILADRATDPTKEMGGSVPADHVYFLRGQPSHTADLAAAGIRTARQVIVLADENAPDKDARTVLTVLSIEKVSEVLQETGERESNIRTIAELIDPDNRDALIRANADEVVCRAEFDERLLVQTTLNPGLSRFLTEILTVDEDNEIIEVPVRGNEDPPVVGKTFDEVLVTCRAVGALLVAIDQGGAPGAVQDSGHGDAEPPAARGKRITDALRAVGSGEIAAIPRSQATKRLRRHLRPMLTNPFRKNERNYRIKVGDSLLFLAESEDPLEKIFGDAREWLDAFREE